LELEILFCYNCINVNDNVVIFKAKCEDLVAEAIPAFRSKSSFLNLFLLAKKRASSGRCFSAVKNRFKNSGLSATIRAIDADCR